MTFKVCGHHNISDSIDEFSLEVFLGGLVTPHELRRREPITIRERGHASRRQFGTTKWSFSYSGHDEG
jgi:hypothetical protein